MHLPKLKFNIRPSNPLIYLRLSILAITTLIMGGLCFVLYRDFYQTIVQAETVLVLKQEVALKDIEIDLFHKVRSINDYKLSSLLPDVIFDPFASDKTVILPDVFPTNVATTTPPIVNN